jgi:hypothetical protein
VDSKGRRRLPIHDEAHVRNALGRFERVPFENDAAREAARRRLLIAAKKYGIVPVGFITGQLRSERVDRSSDFSTFPTGSVTFLLTDIEGSTLLLGRLGDGCAGPAVAGSTPTGRVLLAEGLHTGFPPLRTARTDLPHE